MYEVELKIRADHEPVRERLRHLGATRRDAVTQVDTYYDAPHRDFAETDEALRIRREQHEEKRDSGGTARETIILLTYKGPLVDAESKTREEVETAVGDPEALDAALSALGFESAVTVQKDREHWHMEGYTVTLDAVDGLGEFVEVETEVAEESGVEAAREGAVSVLETLGLDPDAGIRTSYLGLLLEDESP